MLVNGSNLNSYFKNIHYTSNTPIQIENKNESEKFEVAVKSFVKKLESKAQLHSKPIASFKIEVSKGSYQILKIYKWDSIKSVLYKFCKSHKLDNSVRSRLIEIITNHMCFKDLKELVK